MNADTKACSICGVEKPRDDFYIAHKATATRSAKVQSRCKKCMNARYRPNVQSARRINHVRARHRAVQDLIDAHSDEFDVLYELRLTEARQEAEALASTPEAQEHYKDEPVRLRPGKRKDGQKAGDRIDVARCPHCIKHHDRGHVCTKCGMAPIAALRLPDDGEVDEIAVERAANGDTVRLTKRERVEVIRLMVKRGKSDQQIATALHVTPETVFRYRAEHNIESRWTA